MAALDARHSSKAENQAALLEIERVRAENLETKQEIVVAKLEMEELVIRKDIKADNVTRDYYQVETLARDLSKGEQRRLNNLEESLSVKYDEQRINREQLHEQRSK